MEPGRSILLFYWYGSPEVNPSVGFLADRLPGDGWSVRIVGREEGRFAGAAARLAAALPGRLGAEASETVRWLAYAAGAVRVSLRERPDRVVAFDPEGCLPAWLAARVAGAPLVVWSLEIWPEESMRRSFVRRLQRAGERWIVPRARACVVQDADRAAAWGRVLGRPLPETFHVPNAAWGPPVRARTRFLHERLGLPADARILLYAGFVHERGLFEEVLREAACLPLPYRVVVHFPRFDAPPPDWIRDLAKEGAILLSTDLLPRASQEEMLASAWAMLVGFPTGRGENYDLIPHASGKIGAALKCGLPLIAWGPDPLRVFVERTGTGVFLDGAADLPSALARVETRRDRFGEAATTTYDREMEMERAARRFLEILRPAGP